MKRRNARRTRPPDIARTIAAVLSATLFACAGPRPDSPPQWDEASSAAAAALEAALAAAPAMPAGELVVRLAFEADADLDLYVSDPLDETVYYANTPVRSGGQLEGDRRCEHAGRRVETVRFAKPLPGRYRVGVDFQHRCREGADLVPWAISIDARGERRLLRGLARHYEFDPVVEEFHLAD